MTTAKTMVTSRAIMTGAGMGPTLAVKAARKPWSSIATCRPVCSM
jgi:hypothetical protein